GAARNIPMTFGEMLCNAVGIGDDTIGRSNREPLHHAEIELGYPIPFGSRPLNAIGIHPYFRPVQPRNFAKRRGAIAKHVHNVELLTRIPEAIYIEEDGLEGTKARSRAVAK